MSAMAGQRPDPAAGQKKPSAPDALAHLAVSDERRAGSRRRQISRTYVDEKGGGWGTWIRTRTNGVRVRSSTVKLSPTVTPHAASSGAFRGDTRCRDAGAAAVARSIDAPAGSVYPPPCSFHHHRSAAPESRRLGRAGPHRRQEYPRPPTRRSRRSGPHAARTEERRFGRQPGRRRRQRKDRRCDWRT